MLAFPCKGSAIILLMVFIFGKTYIDKELWNMKSSYRKIRRIYPFRSNISSCLMIITSKGIDKSASKNQLIKSKFFTSQHWSKTLKVPTRVVNVIPKWFHGSLELKDIGKTRDFCYICNLCIKSDCESPGVFMQLGDVAKVDQIVVETVSACDKFAT